MLALLCPSLVTLGASLMAVVRAGSRFAAFALIACVAPGTGETDLPGSVTEAVGCEGERPACITGCTTRMYLGRPSCDDGVWHCDGGVRTDLCCDPIHAPEQCPEWGDDCSPESACAEGYTCVTSRSWPLPTEEGVCRLGDWSIPEPLGDCSGEDVLEGRRLFDLGPAAVKLDGIVQVEPVCDEKRCTSDNPCCQRCLGSYALDLATVGEEPMLIGLRTETLSCAGTNCGFTCAPLQPGRRYRVWGLWVPEEAGNGALYVAGSCAD